MNNSVYVNFWISLWGKNQNVLTSGSKGIGNDWKGTSQAFREFSGITLKSAYFIVGKQEQDSS